MNVDSIIYEEAENINDEVEKHRKYFRKNPEFGTKLPKTTAYVVEELEEMGYAPKVLDSGSILAVVGMSGETSVVLVADIDSFPDMKEPEGEYMKACGNDLQAAMLLGTAKILKQHQAKLKGQVKLIFQTAQSAKTTSSEQIVDSSADIAVSARVFKADSSGVMAGLGEVCASLDTFRITIQGKGTHGGMPNLGIDPINVAAHIILSLQTLNVRENYQLTPLVITVGKFDGGQVPNIIPDKVVLEGTIRTYSPKVRDMAKRRTEEIAVQTAALFNASAELEFLDGVPAIITDEVLVEELSPSVERAVGSDNYEVGKQKIMISESFAFIAEKVPSAYFAIKTNKDDKQKSAVLSGIALMSQCAIDWLANKPLV